MERIGLHSANNKDIWPFDDHKVHRNPGKNVPRSTKTLPSLSRKESTSSISNDGKKRKNRNIDMMQENDNDDYLEYLDYTYDNVCDSSSTLRRVRDPERESLLEEEYAERNYSADKRSGNVPRCLILCFAMLLFFLLLYIPVYKQANTQIGSVAGWSRDVSRDTKIYVQPGNTTAIHEPKNVCPRRNPKTHTTSKNNVTKSDADDNQLFLLIIVCSSTANFKARSVIRETWANYTNYVSIKRPFDEIRHKYSAIHAKLGDAKPNLTVESTKTILNESKRVRRDLNHESVVQLGIANLGAYLPQLAAAVNVVRKVEEEGTTEKLDGEQGERNEEEIRFEDEDAKGLLPEFEMNKVLGDEAAEENLLDYEQSEDTNVMKIPPRGYADNFSDLTKIVNVLRKSEIFSNINQSIDKTSKYSVDNNRIDKNSESSSDKENKLGVKEKKIHLDSVSEVLSDTINSENRVEEKLFPRYKVVFLLGLPSAENDSDVQSKIDEEAEKYGDIIQEDFMDSYNNLTLKSVMLLKWVVTHCNQRVRYILKTDDDMFVNVVNLERALEQARSSWEAGPKAGPHQMLAGDLICGARPVSDQNNKWYSPRYMYGGRIYPRYLSGTGYVLSEATAHSLYEAALHTPLFHLEDIYITGMCAARAKPPIKPTDVAGFSFSITKGGQNSCALYTRITAHGLPAQDMKRLMRVYKDTILVDRCERLHIAQIKRDILNKKRSRRSKQKKQNKKVKTS